MAQNTLNDLLRCLHRLCEVQATRDLSDSDLLERFLSRREESAFAILVHRHGPMVLGLCQRVLQDRHAAEDAFQATFLVLVRKSASIRKRTSLGSWLYGVAQRIALRTRARSAAQQQRERRTIDMPRVESLDEITWQELRAVLDEEIGALPERQRAPVVLCYLQGKSYEEAARELGWPKSSLASRISRAKETLRQRLTRRGIAISTAALSAALAEGTAGAEVPALLTINTVHGAALIAAGKTAAAVSTAALAMAEESIRSIAIAKAGIVLLVLAAGVAVGSLGIASSSPFAPRMGALPQTERRQTEKPSTPEKTPRAEEPANPLNETFTFGGRVLDPDGKPFAGAKVFVCGLNPGVIEFRERTVSGSDGTFRIVIRRDEFGEKGVVAPGRSPPERNVFIGATAEGFGAACDSAYKPEDREKLTLWLPAEEIVRGRIMDLEGKPVQGAQISAYIRGTRADQNHKPLPFDAPSQAGYYSGNVLPFDESRNLAKSDKDGRFTLRGLGRGWLYDLHISGPTVVNAKAELVARPEPAKEVGGTGI